MAEKYPLVSNTNTLTIEELPIGDTLLVDNLKVTGEARVEGDLTVIGNINADLGNVVVENLTVEGKTDLGQVGNITITGGSTNYVLRTDGTGNLSWANIQSEIANPAGSNTYVQYNNNGLFGASAKFRFNADTNTVDIDGILQTTVSKLGSVSNVHILGGSNGQVLATDGNGNLSWVDDATDPTVADGGNASSSILYLASLNSGNAFSAY